jgi:hypothetical protein
MTVTAIPDGSLTYTGFSPISGGVSTLIPSGGLAYIGQIVTIGASQTITKIHLPPPNVPFVGNDGRVRPEWYKFLENMFRRMGGAESDLVAQSAIIAQNAASSVTATINATASLSESVAALTVTAEANAQYIENYGPRITSLEKSSL